MGFLVCSAFMNALFGFSLGRAPLESYLYGAVSVLVVACNALCPFFVASSQRSLKMGALFLWAICIAYSLTSAFGFAAENRSTRSARGESGQYNYQTAIKRLSDLEATRQKYQKPPRDLEVRIDTTRREVAELRAAGLTDTDAQSSFLSRMSFGLVGPGNVRLALVTLFALIVEFGATLLLYIALSYEPKMAAPAQPAAKPATPPPKPARWQPKKKVEVTH